MVNQLKKKVDFSYKTLCTEYPKFILTTKYDKVFPKISINPYESQKKLVNTTKEHDEALILYIAMIGSGKTSSSLALSEYVRKLQANESALKPGKSNPNKSKRYNNRGKLQAREKKDPTAGTVQQVKDKKPIQLLFVCSVEPVRLQVCRIAYTNEVPFGIGVIDKGNVRVINNYNCAKGKDPILVVSDIDSAIELLKVDQNYILFLDEPTVGADVPNHSITNKVAELLEYAPAKTILCSATLPFKHEIPEIVSKFQERHTNAEVHTIHSMESIIGCEIKSFSGKNITPHNNCNSGILLQFSTCYGIE
jgi:hypothetical protein